jgi:hypothetical protein
MARDAAELYGECAHRGDGSLSTSELRTSIEVIGPPAVALAYIPYEHELPSRAWAFLGRLARFLFRTGNGPRRPPLEHAPRLFRVSDDSLQLERFPRWTNGPGGPIPTIGHADDLDVFRSTKEFRTVLWIRSVSLSANPNGLGELRFDAYKHLGYTPEEREPSSRHLEPWSGPDHYWPAESPDEETEVEWFKDHARLTLTYLFRLRVRIHPVVDRFFQNWVPAMRMRIQYSIYLNGRIVVSFRGSYIPNQLYQVGVQSELGHDMRRMSLFAIVATVLPLIGGFFRRNQTTLEERAHVAERGSVPARVA